MRYVFIFLLVFLSLPTVAQNFSSDTTIARIEKSSSLKDKARAYDSASETAWRSGNFQQSLDYSERGLKIAKANNFKSIESSLHNNRGITYDFLNQYPSALKHYFAGLSIQDKLNDPKMKANLLGNIGLIYMYQGSNEKSLSYHKRALKFRQKIDDKHGISASLNNIAIIYYNQKNYKQALENYMACIDIDLKALDTIGLGDDYNNIALVYMDLLEFDRALMYLEKALDIRTTYDDLNGLAETYSNIGELYFNQNEFDRAREYFLKSAEIAEDANFKEGLKYVYNKLSQTEENVGNASKAYSYYRLYIEYRDSIDNSELTRKQTELELNYEFDKEKEVTRLRQEEKERQYKIILIAISTGLVLILLFSILFYRKWKQTQAQREIIEEKNKLVQQKNDEILASISYAKRIQKAILPSNSTLNESFPSNFAMYLPKDIVSGDFYWIDKVDTAQFVAVADCTGHGVPGALMSVVCHNALNRAVHEFNKVSPAEILDKTRELVINQLFQEDTVADGMDISLCAFDDNSNKLTWAGANNPLWIYRKSSNSMDEIKADKQPIGSHQNPSPFSEHEVQLDVGDRIFFFSDGYQDQFGGPNQKKMMRKGFKKAILDSVDLPMNEQNKFLLKTFRNWQANQEQVDDVCVIGIEITHRA